MHSCPVKTKHGVGEDTGKLISDNNTDMIYMDGTVVIACLTEQINERIM